MKKKILLILLSPFVLIVAQEWKEPITTKFTAFHDLRIGIGKKPFEASHWNNFFTYDGYEPIEPNIIDFGTNDFYTGARYTTNAIFGEYIYQTNKWLGIGGTLTYFSYFNNFYNVISDEKVGSNIKTHVSIYPTIRFTWINKPQFSLYQSFGIGKRFIIENNNHPYKPSNSFTNSYGCQVTFLGVTFGKKYYAFSDIVTIGTQGIITVGLGYRIQSKVK